MWSSSEEAHREAAEGKQVDWFGRQVPVMPLALLEQVSICSPTMDAGQAPPVLRSGLGLSERFQTGLLKRSTGVRGAHLAFPVTGWHRQPRAAGFGVG